MAHEKDEVLNANQGSPAADIPDLKKKDKERKKAGAAWSGARGAASSFEGATGGAGGVARAAASAAEAGIAEAGAAGAAGMAEAGGGFFAAISRVLAGLTSTLLGKIAVAAAAFLLMAGAALVGYGLLKGDGNGGLGSPNLGGISSTMKVRSGGNDRIGINSNGELRFDPLNPASQAKTEAKKEEPKPEEKPAPDVPKPDLDAAKAMPKDLLAHNLSGAKLSSSLGGEFGNKNIFSGNSAAPKFDTGKSNLKITPGQKGKMDAMKKGGVAHQGSARSMAKARTSRAIGQLRVAKGMSMLGAQSSNAEQAAAAAQGAFDQQAPSGGLNTPTMPGDTVAPAAGGSAPDTSMPTGPDVPTSTGVDPGLTNALNGIGNMANQAGQMKQTGTMLCILGGVLIAAGIALLFWPMTAIGIALIAIGALILGMGIMMIQMANQMADMAKQMGSMLSSRIGNDQQSRVVNYCTDQALNGTNVQNCQPPESVTQDGQVQGQTQQDVQRVRNIGNDNPKFDPATP